MVFELLRDNYGGVQAVRKGDTHSNIIFVNFYVHYAKIPISNIIIKQPF